MHKFVEENFDKTISALKLFYTESDWRWLVSDREEMNYVVTAFTNQVFTSVNRCTVDGKTSYQIARENFKKYFAIYKKHYPEAIDGVIAQYGSPEKIRREKKVDEVLGTALCWAAMVDEVKVHLDKWYDNGCSTVRKQGNCMD